MNKLLYYLKIVLTRLLSKTNWYKNKLFPECQKFWKHSTFNLDVVNLGSSSGICAFNYEGIPIRAANWALKSNPLMGDREILRNYYSYLKEGAIVIIPLCPYSALAGSYVINEDIYYTLLYSSSIPSFSKKRQQRVNLLKDEPYRYYPLYELLVDVKHLFVKWFVRDKNLSEEQFEIDAKNWQVSWCKEFSINNWNDPLSLYNKDSIADAKSILNDILTFCHNRGLRPVVVVPPIYHTLAETFTEKARNILLNEFLSDFCGNVEIYNCMNDEFFTKDRSFFSNSFFLNRKGAKLFTRQLLSQLNIV